MPKSRNHSSVTLPPFKRPQKTIFWSNCDCNIGPFSTAIKMHRQQCRNHNYWPKRKKSKSKLKFPPFFSDPPKIKFFGIKKKKNPPNTHFIMVILGLDGFWGILGPYFGIPGHFESKIGQILRFDCPLSATVAPLF